MNRQNKKIQTKSVFPKAFVITVLAAYLANALSTIWLFNAVYGSQPVMSQFTLMAILTIVAPPIYVNIAYWLLNGTQRLYIALQLALTTSAVAATIKALMVLVPPTLSPFYNEFAFYFQYEIAPILISGIVLGVLLWRYRQSLVEGLSQKVLAVSIVGLYLATTLQSLYFVVQQLPDNPNLSAFIYGNLPTILLPLLIFAIAYFTNKTKGKWLRITNSILVSAVTILILLSIASLTWVIWDSISPDRGTNNELVPGTIALLTLVVIGIILYIRRRR